MEEERIVRLIRQLNLFLMQYERELMESRALTPAQSRMLGYLLSQKKTEYSATDIHEAAGISRPTISGTLKELRRKGFLLMEEMPEDERKKRIVLTEQAYGGEEEIAKKRKERQECILKGIPKEKLEIAEECLEQMLSNIRQERDRRNKT